MAPVSKNIERIRIRNKNADPSGSRPATLLFTLCLALHSGGRQRPPFSSWGKSASMSASGGTSARVTGKRPSRPGGIIGHSGREALLGRGDTSGTDDRREV